ncbi:saccharopine dehydrogenase family protein [Arthrobacter sp. 135MFCol5.1]|uniref:saccharopine dehydrogenase family protein n=1 Tax=Arthrobacter sp. 135MFCol5.1 TaxID=1158050 RepID=UPI00035FE0BE|nr:saccharopine dehydrogenase NADP-binding domain-containing protein [Arthrobacter sp. 135MFCol5.1]
MTSVLILGGGGYQGSSAARILAGCPEVSHLILVDRNVEAIEQTASCLGDNVQTDTTDIRDRAGVLELIKRHDPTVVLNCAGPFRSFGVSSAAAAIEAGVNYVDILDDGEVVPDYLALDEAARAAGVTAIFGAGFTPGLTNIIGRILADDLDEVEEMHWSYLVNPTLSVAPHLMTHRVQMFGPEVSVIEDGKAALVPGGSQLVEIDWPGFPRLKAGVCSHPEPLTAKRYFPDIQRAAIRACYTAPSFLDLLVSLGNANLGSSSEFESDGRILRADRVIGDFLGSEVFKASPAWAKVVEAEDRYGPVDGVRVAVAGRSGGDRVQRVLQYVTKERWLTTHGVAAAVALLLATGAVQKPGMHSAEVLDPEVMIPALKDAGIELGTYSTSDAPEFYAEPVSLEHGRA